MTCKPLRIIDAHQHVFWHDRDDHGLITDLDEHGIEKAWLLGWEMMPYEDSPYYHRILNPVHMRPDGTHAGIPLSDLILARDRYPDRFILGYCPHPTQPSAPQMLRAAAKVHGVQVCGEWKFRMPFDDPRCLEVFYAAGELGLPVLLHLDVPYLLIDGKRTYQGYWYGGTVDNLERALKLCPETTFIGHAPGFWREIDSKAEMEASPYPKGPVTGEGRLYRLLYENSNLMADLSAGSGLGALKRDPAHAQRFLTQFADRLLFARDYYGQELQQFLQTIELTQEVVDKIYFRNAEHLLARN